MKNSLEFLTDILRQSLTDDVMTRAEKKSLRDALSEVELSSREKIKLMSEVKNLAHRQSASSDTQNLVSWVYEAFQTIAKNPSSEASHSAYFSPGEECRQKIIKSLNSAVRKIDICVFTISDDSITETILERHGLGIPVRIISDNDKAFDRGSDLFRLRERGIEIRFDTGPAHMHHKFALMDETLLTGSYNWTRSAAQENYENILVTDERGLLKEFTKEFDRLWARFA